MLSLIPAAKKFVEKNLKCDSEQAGYVTFSFDFFFYVMASYYILKPMRDLTGVMLGNTSSLFRWTMVAVLVVNPLFSMLMARIPRVQLVPVVYRFFISHLLLFFIGFVAVGVGTGHVEGSARIIPSLFFVWVSVVNLFAVSLFWSVMADRFTGAQGRKVFGFIGAGGTLGQMAGSALATQLPTLIGVPSLLILSAILLELSVRCRPSLDDVVREQQKADAGTAKEKPKPWTGVLLVMKSPYLFGICAYLFLYSFTSSFIYLQKQDLVGAAFHTQAEQLQFFAQINFVVSAATLAIQLFFTGRLITSLGLIFSLSFMPAITSVGFSALALAPGLYLLAAFEAIRTTLNYAISRPSREILFTVVSKEDKYISKNFIDTFVYRAGDSIASFAFDGLKGFNLGTTGISWAAVPFSVVWTGLAMGLGSAQRRKQKIQEEELARLEEEKAKAETGFTAVEGGQS